MKNVFFLTLVWHLKFLETSFSAQNEQTAPDPSFLPSSLFGGQSCAKPISSVSFVLRHKGATPNANDADCAHGTVLGVGDSCPRYILLYQRVDPPLSKGRSLLQLYALSNKITLLVTVAEVDASRRKNPLELLRRERAEVVGNGRRRSSRDYL